MVTTKNHEKIRNLNKTKIKKDKPDLSRFKVLAMTLMKLWFKKQCKKKRIASALKCSNIQCDTMCTPFDVSINIFEILRYVPMHKIYTNARLVDIIWKCSATRLDTCDELIRAAAINIQPFYSFIVWNWQNLHNYGYFITE